MNHFSKLFGLFSICLLFASCEKEVHINLATSPSQVVVQGAIESGVPPYVFLTSTVGFFSKIDLATLENSFLHGAVITVSDGSKTITLHEYAFDTGKTGAKFYIYSVDTIPGAPNFMIGETGKSYSLSITYNGKTYTSITKVPQPKGIDSMWFGVPIFTSSKTPDSAKQLFVNYTDPDTLGNYVRYFTAINSQQYYAVDQFNDEVVNGKPLTQIPLTAGFDDAQDVNVDSLRYFYKGDTVYLKWSEIDKATYDFWNSYSYARNATGNPFASPINLKTNISNGALGIWGGYGSLVTMKVVP